MRALPCLVTFLLFVGISIAQDQKPQPAPSPFPDLAKRDPVYAGMFTGEYFIEMPKRVVDYEDLDAPLSITTSANMPYPKALAHTRYVGHLRGFAVVRRDASVTQLIVTDGNNVLFKEAAEAYAATWKFSAPTHIGNPVDTIVNFEFLVTEDRVYGPFLFSKKRAPTQAAEPSQTGGVK